MIIGNFFFLLIDWELNSALCLQGPRNRDESRVSPLQTLSWHKGLQFTVPRLSNGTSLPICSPAVKGSRALERCLLDSCPGGKE